MSSNKENINSGRVLKPIPILSWQEAAQTKETAQTNIVNLESYRRNLKPQSETTLLSWELPTVDAAKPVKLIMVSSGFVIRGLGGSSSINCKAA
jgi:hypothetical protein